MELELTRVDYTIVGLTSPNCLKLLPNINASGKQQQKIIVGDHDGVLQVFSIKKDEVHIQFKTLPGDKIIGVQLGGLPGTAADKIFIGSNNKIRGYNKKGKLFLTFDTNLTENIKTFCVSGNDLLVCGNHLYNHYRDCKDLGSYLCGDTIVDVVALCPNNTNRIVTVLACSGRVLRLLEHCRVRQTIELESIPTCMHVPKSNGDKLICGFSDGTVILFTIGHFATDVKQEYLVNDKANTSAIICMHTYEMYNDDKDILLLGRRDGTIQIFTLCTQEDILNGFEPKELYKNNFNECITSISCGYIGHENSMEVVVCTYTGRLFGLTTKCIARTLTDNNLIHLSNQSNNTNQVIISSDIKMRIDKLKSEIKDLKENVCKEREKYQQSTQALSSGLSAIPILNVNDAMVLSKDDASYIITIEVQASIENVLVQSDVPIDLIDVENNTAVVSFSECDPLNGNHLLATYRCQLNTNRLDIKIRTIEGQHGTLQLYITPNIQPKCCQLRRYMIQPLSLHMLCHIKEEFLQRPLNVLILKGTFSQAEIHNWISYCIPEIPEKLQTIDKISYTFQNVFIGTILMCEFSKGEAEFKSDNISTISILKDVLTKEATKKRIKLEITTNIEDKTISHIIKLIEPQLMKYLKYLNDYKLLNILLDLDIRNTNELDLLNEHYKYILNNKKEIVNDYKTEPIILERLYGLLTDLYIDRYKFNGINVKLKIPMLIQLLDNYNYDKLIEFFL